MKQYKSGNYVEKVYDTAIYEDFKELAKDRFLLLTRGIPVKERWDDFGSKYVTLILDLRHLSRIHEVGLMLVHG